MLNACTEGSFSVSFIVENPVVPKVKSDCGHTSLYASGNATNGGSGCCSVSGVAVGMPLPACSSNCCDCPGLLPAVDANMFVPSS